MGRSRSAGERRSRALSSGPPAAGDAFVPPGLARSRVYQRVPAAVRARLDEAILLRPDDCATPEAMADCFELEERYGVSIAALKSYAGKLEQLVRPALASQLLAGVLGCLPEAYRQQLVAGSQVLLLSRVVKALTAQGDGELAAADLAKLASILSSLAGRAANGRVAPPRRGKRRSGEEPAEVAPVAAHPAKLAETVRMLYGLSWPPDEPADPNAAA